ncbi:MAG: transketolase [bacterium]|nr:transketolase [bacterium]
MLKESQVADLTAQARQIRQAVVAMLALAGSGHPASSLGSADIFAWLYGNLLRKNPELPQWPERDYFLLSAGHLAPAWYATLAQHGYFPHDFLLTLRQLGSPLQGHPQRNLALGIENSAGPLGQGVSMAAGLAYGLQEVKSEQRVFVLSSDGEQEEGQVWEAYLFAANYKLSNFCLLIDQNRIQQSGKVQDVMKVEDLLAKLLAFNFSAVVADGNNFASLDSAWQKVKRSARPKAIICQTVPGKGVSFMENDYHWHAQAVTAAQAKQAWQELEAKC